MNAPISSSSFSIGTPRDCPNAAKFDRCNYRWIVLFDVSLIRCNVGDVN